MAQQNEGDARQRERDQHRQAPEGARQGATQETREHRGAQQKSVSKGENLSGGNIEQETQNDKKLRP